MTSLGLAIVAASAAALIAAYMRRPRMKRRLRLGAARFLVDFSPASRSRLALAPLLHSRMFFIRMLFIAAVAAALLPALNRDPAGGDARLGLRIIVDTTASMGVAGQAATGAAATRAAQARTLVAALLRDKEAEAQAKNYRLCTRILAVDRETRLLPPGSLEAALVPRRLGGDPRLLESAALGEDAGCPPTHAVVVTDRRKPAMPAAADGRAVLWWQVGRPVPNAAIEAVTVDADPLLPGPVRVSFAVRQYGAAGEPRQGAVTGPDGAKVPLSADCTRHAGEFCFEAKAPGRYTIALAGADAFAGDDRAVVTVPEIKALAVDWRLRGIPAPPALRIDDSPDAILVARAEDNPDIASRRAVLIGGTWSLDPDRSKLGFFNPDDPLLENVNIDLIEQAAPSALALPAGFVRAAAVDGRDIIARRSGPRAALVPPPLWHRDAAAALRNASLLLFANALRYVSADHAPPQQVSFIDADGQELPDVRFESDTAEDGDRSDLAAAIAPAPAGRGDGGAPLWPWLVVAALAILAVERAVALPWRRA
jgi:hypothetical protein